MCIVQDSMCLIASSCWKLCSILSNHTKQRTLGCCRRFAMCAGEVDKNYQAAVERLNSLQTNASVLDEAQRAKRERRSRELSHMVAYLGRIGLETSDLDRMNAIHVTGTKGKGSVCAMAERILRAHGLKTGFYSSPHLREVRERIRLNGRPLPKAQFVEYFWEVYDKLLRTKNQHDGMPPYFRFLTLMAFNVFLREKVDVAVVEVGIGGTFDSTNIIPNPVVCGIASLGLDHVELLGDTLEKIAWQKGGICKPGHPAYTVSQEEGPLRVLQERAKELQALPLEVAPELSEYPGEEPVLALVGEHQKTNASLAVQLCRRWLQFKGLWRSATQEVSGDQQTLHGVGVAQPFPLPSQFYEGLRECCWPGRNQIIKRGRISYYIDGAHTPQSVETSAQWFSQASAEEAKTLRGEVVRVLIFNITGRRISRADVYLSPLVGCGFDYALFSPNITGMGEVNSADITNLTVTTDTMLDCVRNNKRTWQELLSKHNDLTPGSVERRHPDHVTGHVTSDGPRSLVFTNLKETVEWVAGENRDSALPPPHRLLGAECVQVLVTGSLHLTGAFMSVLDIDVDES